MPGFCGVIGCSNRANRDNVRFFRIPAVINDRGKKLGNLSRERRACWIKSLKRGEMSDSYLKNARICSNHFVTGAPSPLEDKETPDWIPTQNMDYGLIEAEGKPVVNKNTRSAQTETLVVTDKSIDSSSIRESMPSTSEEPTSAELEQRGRVGRRDVAVQTDLTMEILEKHFGDLKSCTERIQLLQNKLYPSHWTEETLLTDDDKVSYFTGFTKYAMVLIVFKQVNTFMSTRSNLSPFKQFILTLMKLRLDLPFELLSYDFGVPSAESVEEIFYECIDIFYQRFRSFVFWPQREILHKVIPACFKENFGNKIAAIISCFEIRSDTSSDAHYWSDDELPESVKVLIGITPQGTVSFISEAWTGNTTHKHLIENCGFLDKFLEGDLVLADSGFTLQESVEDLDETLETPIFRIGENQLDPVDLELKKKTANVRIHVERVTGLLKEKYEICRGPLPASMIGVPKNDKSELDKILVVCGAFINMCPAVIPLN